MISDLFRLALEHRRRWLDAPAAADAAPLPFNDADVVLLGLLLHAFETTSLVATDRRLHDRLKPVLETPKPGPKPGSKPGPRAADAAAIDLSMECPPDRTSIVLVPVERAGDAAVAALAGREDRVVAVYGWTAGWSPASWTLSAWPDQLTFTPTASLSPALWRSGIQLLATPSRSRAIQAGLDRVASVFNDRYLDTCALLEQIQKLEENLRGRNTSLLAAMPEQVEQPVEEGEQIQELKQTIEELHRTISLLQHGLAFAHTEIARTIKAL